MPKSIITATEDQLQEEFELELCQRDYGLLESYHPGIFAYVCKLVAHNVELEAIKKWAERMVKNEPIVVQRIINAARYERKLQVKR